MRRVLWLVLVVFLLSVVIGCKEEPVDKSQMILYSSLSASIPGLDPMNMSDANSSRVAAQLLEPLYTYHSFKRPYELIPMVADGMPQVSEDKLSYTIKLKKGILFADDECFPDGKGRELTVNDFVFAWKRIADTHNTSKNWWVFENRIAGLDDFRDYTSTVSKADVDYSKEVEGLQCPDNYTLVIKLKRPWPQIGYLLAFLPTSPMAKEAVDYYGRKIINHPVGTGPYKIKVWHRDNYIDLIRNANYRNDYYPSEGSDDDAAEGLLDYAGRQVPLAERTIFKVIKEEQVMWFMFLKGKLDLAGIPKDNFGQAISISQGLTPEMEARGISLKKFREPTTFWLGFNMNDELLGGNKALRKAIVYCLDRKEYIDLFWNGRGDVAHGFIPTMMKAYDETLKSTTGEIYDPERAKEYLKEAEELHGGKIPPLKLLMNGTNTLNRQMGEFYRKQFEKIGLVLEVDYLDWAAYLEEVKRGSPQMFFSGWIADYPDTENFLQLFSSKNHSPGPNDFRYTNPEFDRIFEEASKMSDSPERIELYRQAERLVVEDAPAAFMYHRVSYFLVHDWMKNFKPHVFHNYDLHKLRDIDLEKRNGYKELLRNLND